MIPCPLSPADERTAQDIAAWLGGCRRLLFITGAGLSADSGLPTYRGIGGLYESQTTDEGMAIEEALSGHVFAARPELGWKYIARIEAACRGAEPNPGHHVMADLQDRFDVWILSQNVDGLHRAAGSSQVMDIHGDIHDLRCTRCAHQATVTDYADLDLPPRCPACGAIVRPAVVLFGEMLPHDTVRTLGEQLAQGFDAVFSVGTSSLFPYIVEPVLRAHNAAIPTVEINPGRTVISDMVDFKMNCGAAAAMAGIQRALQA